MIIPVKRGLKGDPRCTIPPYLADPDYAAPCFCGQAITMSNPAVMIEGDTGLKRLVHVGCLPPGMMAEAMDEDDEA